jgi:hypothetical protein
MDRLGGATRSGHGWFAFDAGQRTPGEVAELIAATAKARGLSPHLVTGTVPKITLAFPEGDAQIELLDVPGGAPRTRLAVCRTGAADAVAQARGFLRAALGQGGAFSSVLSCDAATWRTLPELGPHRAALRGHGAANVLAGIGWCGFVSGLLLLLLFDGLALRAADLTCGPEPPGSHASFALGAGAFGTVLFAAVVVPGVYFLGRRRRTVGHAVVALFLMGGANLLAICEFAFLTVATLC